jgi:hypothetical protein
MCRGVVLRSSEYNKCVVLQTVSAVRKYVNNLKKEQVRLHQRLGAAAPVRIKPEAAALALEAVCMQLDFVRTLRERHSAQLQIDVDKYNLVSFL